MSGLIPFSNVKLQYEQLKEETLSVIDGVLSTGVLLDGPEVKTLESHLKRITGRKYAVITHSGTVALQIVAKYYKGRADTVNIPAVSFPATVNAFIDNGWMVNFLDVDYYGIGVQDDESSNLTCAVGLYGLPVKAENYPSLFFVEDAAQSWLAKEKGTHTQTISFDPTKNLASTGNGGALVTNDEGLERFARMYVNHGKANDGEFILAGSNVRMSEIECAVLNMKTQYLDQWQERRRNIAAHWIEFISAEHLITPQNIGTHGLQKFVMRIPRRHRFVDFMKAHGIECKVHYKQALPDLVCVGGSPAPESNDYQEFIEEVISLPFYPELTDNQVEFVAETAQEFLLLK